MAEPITLTTDGLLLNWLKNVGDSVNKGEVIAEIEADKATMEIEAPANGTITEIKAEVGAELSEGDVIAMIGASGESAPTAESADAEETAEQDEAEAAPEEQPNAQAAPSPAAQSTNGKAATTPEGRVKISPVARKMAEDKGINVEQVEGSGPGGRITKRDIENFTPGAAPAPAAAPSAPAAAPDGRQTYGRLPEPSEDVEILDVNRMRRAIADGTILSTQMTPHFYVSREIDMETLLNLRKELNEKLADEGIKISVNDMVIKATALAVKKFPNLNTHYYGDKLVRYKRINIGVAVALPNNGLMNVVVHDADRTALSVMAEQNRAMYERAREGKVKPDDLKGATFTVSNLGPYDVDFFSAIISPPEAGILAVGGTRKIPVVREDGSIGVGLRMIATVSVDHRVSDGAEGAEFIQEFKNLIENPMRLLV